MIEPARRPPGLYDKPPLELSKEDLQRGFSFAEKEKLGDLFLQDPEPHHDESWAKIFSYFVNSLLLRGIVYYTWKFSLEVTRLVSNKLHHDMTLDLFASPVPSYFDIDLQRKCALPLKECFVEEMQRISHLEPTQQLFAKLSTLRIPFTLVNSPIEYKQCKDAFEDAVKNLIASANPNAEHPLHFWVGLKEPPPSHILQSHPELLEISPDFIEILSSLLKRGQKPIQYLHFYGEFGGTKRLDPLLSVIQENDTLTYVQLSPNDLLKDSAPLFLLKLLTSAPNLRQIVVSSNEGKSLENPLPPTYWEIATQAIVAHPRLQSLIIRNMGAVPQDCMREILAAGKHISFA